MPIETCLLEALRPRVAWTVTSGVIVSEGQIVIEGSLGTETESDHALRRKLRRKPALAQRATPIAVCVTAAPPARFAGSRTFGADGLDLFPESIDRIDLSDLTQRIQSARAPRPSRCWRR